MAMLPAEKSPPRVFPLSRKPDDAVLTVSELASLLKVTPGHIYTHQRWSVNQGRRRATSRSALYTDRQGRLYEAVGRREIDFSK
jgi:hypothetical protein